MRAFPLPCRLSGLGMGLTREEFLQYVMHGTHMLEGEIDEIWIIEECDCDYEHCQGWRLNDRV